MSKRSITGLIIIFVIGVAFLFFTFAGDLPIRYGYRIRLGENSCAVVADLWKDYRRGEINFGVGLYRRSLILCPSDPDVKQIQSELSEDVKKIFGLN